MGGAHVFPGGRVEALDHVDPHVACTEVDAAAARMPDVPPADATAFHVAAIRELFEEAGVLLAHDDAGRLIAIHEAARGRFDTYRRDLSAHRITLTDIVRAERLELACDALAYFAHWVTPAIETRRFDTRFFVAAAPEAQDASHDNGELTHSVWMRPAHAIDACRHGDIALPPPTWTTLRWLSEFDSVERAIAWARAKTVPRVEPGFIQRGETRIVLLPGDPECAALDGFEARETRFILAGGRWTPASRETPRRS